MTNRLAAAAALTLIIAGCGSTPATRSATQPGPSASASPASSAPSPSPASAALPGGRLIFARYVGDAGSLFTANPDGTGVAPLPVTGVNPRWSPDGRHLSVPADNAQGRLFVGVVDPDGRHYVQFTSPDPMLDLGCYAWSPDGSRLACEGWDESDLSRNGLYTVRATDGGDLVRVTASPHGAHDIPSDYSPDGNEILFTRQRLPDEADVTLMVVTLAGGAVRSVSDQRLYGGRWSPDGTTILLDGDGSLRLVPVDGGAIRTVRIDSPVHLPALGGVWSPDGEWILFSGHNETSWDLYVMRSDGTDLVQLTDTPGRWEGEVDWR